MHTTQDEAAFLRGFYQALNFNQTLDPQSPRYVPLYGDGSVASGDPVAELQATIEWSESESCQLFSGFRGTGKSTELLRLKQQLEDAAPGATVVLRCDMQDYLNLSLPVDVPDFLLALALALADAARDPAVLGAELTRESLGERLWGFLTRTQVQLDEVSVDAGLASLKLSLKGDPGVKRQVQERMQGHVAALAQEVHLLVEALVKRIRGRHGAGVRVVAIFDSIEQLRGVAGNAGAVADSVANLFHAHADKLRLPYLHVVYTVPPWLKIKAPAIATVYSGYQQIPCVKVMGPDGAAHQPGLDALERVLRARGDWERLLPNREALDSLLLASGGYLRDLFRLVQTTVRLVRGRSLPASPALVEAAVQEVRNAYLPLSHQDARWLVRIDRSHDTELAGEAQLPDLARLFDNLLVLTYRNGREWFGVHPLVVDSAREIVARLDGPAGGRLDAGPG